MNNIRRKEINKARNMIEQAQVIIQNVKFEEEMAFDNLSEGLQQTLRGETMESNVELMDDIYDAINDVLEQIDEIE